MGGFTLFEILQNSFELWLCNVVVMGWFALNGLAHGPEFISESAGRIFSVSVELYRLLVVQHHGHLPIWPMNQGWECTYLKPPVRLTHMDLHRGGNVHIWNHLADFLTVKIYAIVQTFSRKTALAFAHVTNMDFFMDQSA